METYDDEIKLAASEEVAAFMSPRVHLPLTRAVDSPTDPARPAPLSGNFIEPTSQARRRII